MELFKARQTSQARGKTPESKAYPLRNVETLFGEMVEALSAKEIHWFLMILTDGRARSTARLRYAQTKAFLSFMGLRAD